MHILIFKYSPLRFLCLTNSFYRTHVHSTHDRSTRSNMSNKFNTLVSQPQWSQRVEYMLALEYIEYMEVGGFTCQSRASKIVISICSICLDENKPFDNLAIMAGDQHACSWSLMAMYRQVRPPSFSMSLSRMAD